MESYTRFNPDTTPILFFRPNRSVRHRQGGRHYILWPAFAYRVLAPKPIEHTLNVFQKAVLGFSRAGETEPRKISRWLHLDEEVVKFVQAELRRSGLLSTDLSPTSQGIAALNAEINSLPTEVVAGYVFQDPWQGKLWPRFVERLEYAPVEIGSDGWPFLAFGSPGKPKPRRLWIKNLDSEALARTPSTLEILHASRRHARDRRRGGEIDTEGSSWEDEDDFPTVSPMDKTNIRSVTLINEQPELCYLTTFIYLPDDDFSGREYFAYDPFGLGASLKLHYWMELRAAKDEHLRKFIDNFLNNAFNDSRNLEENINELSNRARNVVIDQLGEEIEQYPFWNLLLAMERTVQEIYFSNEETPKDKREDVLVKAGKALEGLFRFLNGRYPAPLSWKVYEIPDRKSRNDVLNGIAEGMGFRTPLPYGLSGISPYEARRAIESGGGTLAERLVASLLSAHSNTDHPLRTVGIQQPDLFDRLSLIIRLRGQSAHETNIEVSLDVVETQREEVYKIVKTILFPETPKITKMEN